MDCPSSGGTEAVSESSHDQWPTAAGRARKLKPAGTAVIAAVWAHGRHEPEDLRLQKVANQSVLGPPKI
jgi:hypothetical protein